MKSIDELNYLGGELHNLHGKKMLIVLSEIKNFDFYRYLFLINHILHKNNNHIEFLEIEANVASLNFYPKKFQLNQFKKNNYLTKEYRNIFFNAIQSDTGTAKRNVMSLSIGNSPLRKYRTLAEFSQDANIDEACKISIKSIFGTHIAKSIIETNRLTKHESKTISHMINTYNEIVVNFPLDILNNFDSVLVLNGRMPDQAAIVNIVKLNSKDIFHFEHGSVPRETFFFEKFPPQNILQNQRIFLKRYKGDFESIITRKRGEVQSWVDNRRINLPNFGPKFESLLALSPKKIGRRAVLFTSSLSEFDYYSGVENSYTQLDALKIVIPKLIEEKFEIIVRIHPNERNHNWRDLILLSKVLENFEVKTIYPWEPYSSYQILTSADVVVVWDSTLGIESLLLDIPVFALSETSYSLITKIPVVSINQIMNSRQLFTQYKIEQGLAVLAASLRLYYGYNTFELDSTGILQRILDKAYIDQNSKIEKIKFEFQNTFWDKLFIFINNHFDFRFPAKAERLLRKFFPYFLSIKILKTILRLKILFSNFKAYWK